MSRPQYAVLRHNKIKNLATLKAASNHNSRAKLAEDSSERIDAQRSEANRLVVGTEDAYDDVLRRQNALKIKPRKNAVRAVEYVVTASPEHFGGDDPADWSRSKCEAWMTQTTKYMKERHGENLVNLVYHFDESTPHGHAIVLPAFLKEKQRRGRKPKDPAKAKPPQKVWALDAASYVGGKEEMRSEITAYSAAMAPLGLVRAGIGKPSRQKKLDAVRLKKGLEDVKKMLGKVGQVLSKLNDRKIKEKGENWTAEQVAEYQRIKRDRSR